MLFNFWVLISWNIFLIFNFMVYNFITHFLDLKFLFLIFSLLNFKVLISWSSYFRSKFSCVSIFSRWFFLFDYKFWINFEFSPLTVPTPSCLALMPRDPIEFVELKLDNFNDNFGYFKSPDSVSGPGVGSGSEPITVVIEPYKSWSGWFNHQSNDSPLIRFNFSLQSPHHSFFSSSSSSHQFSSSNHHPSQYQLAFFARKNDPPTLTSHHMFEIISLRNQLNEVRINFDLINLI